MSIIILVDFHIQSFSIAYLIFFNKFEEQMYVFSDNMTNGINRCFVYFRIEEATS